MDLFSKLRKMNILLIDDDEWIRHSMGIFFEFEGCDLRTLETAEEGLAELKRQDYKVIIADYRLPGMDGLEFLRRSQKTHPDAMKVLITAYGSREVTSEAYKLGVQDVIKKPFTIESIEKSLCRLIKEREQKI
ncbi:MAG: response regulator [Deltaproteobacteria bacterium]|nr:response regulator [Deltaproteobacteria bacterium]